MPTDPLDPEFALEGPTPKPGQTVLPTNLPAQIRRGQEEALQLGAEMTGVMDVRRVLSGETPWTEAIAGALPMLVGGPEARGTERVGQILAPAAEKAAWYLKNAKGDLALALGYVDTNPALERTPDYLAEIKDAIIRQADPAEVKRVRELELEQERLSGEPIYGGEPRGLVNWLRQRSSAAVTSPTLELTSESELAGRYPKVGPPMLKDAKTNKPITGKTKAQGDKLVEAGKAYWGKKLTPEAEVVKKARTKAQADIEAGNYTPYFKVSERSNVNPTRYPPYQSTVGQTPKRPDAVQKYMTHATNRAGAARLQAAYEEGLKQEGSANWYFMHQLEQEFIKEYGEQGPALFKQRVADALAATTGGADPQANVLSASFANYLAAKGETFPAASHQVPFPVGGGKHGIMPNLEQYQKMMLPGGTGVTPANPKRYNFSANILGEAQASTIDEQMSMLFDPKMKKPEFYGPYQQALNDLAAANGVDPRYFQEVAWAGTKAMKEGYKSKPLIQTYNEAIERTSRITGVSPAEVVRRGIVRAEMPIYGTAGVIGAGVAAEQQHPIISDDVNSALGGGAETVQLAGDVISFPPSSQTPLGRAQIRQELSSGKAKYEAGLPGVKRGPITIEDIKSRVPDDD